MHQTTNTIDQYGEGKLYGKNVTKRRQNLSVSPFDICNSSMINGHFTYHMKNVVFRPQQVKPHVCALIALLIIYSKRTEPNNRTTYQFIARCQIRQQQQQQKTEWIELVSKMKNMWWLRPNVSKRRKLLNG